jgi:hypothetical protein
VRPIHETVFPEVWVEEHELWVQCSAGQIDVGDIFHLRQSNGQLFADEDGNVVWRCTEVPGIPCEPVPDME